MKITTKQYEDSLKVVRKWLKRRNIQFDEFDIVNETWLQYNSLSPKVLKKVFYMFIDIGSKNNKLFSKLATHKTCKNCSPFEPLPVSAFYIFETKTGRLFISSQCIKCDIKKGSDYWKANRHKASYKAARKRINAAYYKRIKNNPEIIEERKKKYKEKIKDINYVKKRNAQRRKYYLKKIDRPLKQKGRPYKYAPD